MTAHSKTIPATLIPGDGIGPEIVESVIEILDAVEAPFVWDRQLAGMAGVDAVNDPLPKQTIESIRRTGLALKGPLTTPVGVASSPSM
ncbi:isocitrate dehydrogenase (NAD+) [Acetobacter ghanensis]|uniref:Isocitrate dehydrogenase (NAD+) n=1 Tax=Acetobacter ghanensis TaxID=431306 RepID=A0A0U5FXY9_9PROT|nr:isocitrate dehydrogenase (NAD+) [Acetobacter ghanensis]